MMNQFSRTELLFGKAAMSTSANARVAVLAAILVKHWREAASVPLIS